MNLLAVLHKQLGDEYIAEDLYLSAMRMDNRSISVLNNYKILLNNQQRIEEAARIEKKILKLDDPNPYRWLEQAYLALSGNKVDLAIEYFEKVIDIAPYVKEAYVGLYNIELSQGDVQGAKDILTQVLPWVYDADDKQYYKGKIWTLSSNK